jgi:hypothetical protein
MLGQSRPREPTVAVFDDDYASLTFAFPDDLLAKAIEEQLMRLIVANARIMRNMPRPGRA